MRILNPGSKPSLPGSILVEAMIGVFLTILLVAFAFSSASTLTLNSARSRQRSATIIERQRSAHPDLAHKTYETP